jgi:putative chitinase
MLTAQMIRSIAPRARQDYVDALVNGADTFELYAINTPLRLAALVANILHETGGLTIVRENLNYTAKRIKQVWPTRPEAVKFAGNPQGLANCVYNGRMGNRKGSDDGWRFRGASFMQTTGRYNFEKIGAAIGVDLGNRPELIEDPVIGLKAACWEMSKLLQYCDMGERGLRAVCNGINRGNPASSLAPIGWEDRQLCYQKALNALAICPAPNDDGILEIGDHGDEVEALQKRLVELRYQVGKIDGVFGSRVRAAVLAFQAENGLKTDGKVGPLTAKAIADEPLPMPLGERAEEGKEELLAAGSTTLQATSLLKTTASIGAVVSTPVAIADTTGLLDSASGLLSDLKQLQGVAGESVAMFAWMMSKWYFLIPVVAYLVYRYADKIEIRRILDHKLGLNLSK